MKKSLALVASLVVSQFAAAALAVTWNGNTSTDWFTATNWTGGVPTAATPADFNDPDPALIAGGAAVANSVNMTSGSLTISSGSLTVSTTSQIGLGAANPTFIQTGGDVVWNSGGLYVGTAVGSGADIYDYSGGTFNAVQMTVRGDGQFDHNNSLAPVNVTTMTVGATTGNHVFNLNGNVLNVGGAFTLGAGSNTGTSTFNFGNPLTAEFNFTTASGSLNVTGTSNFIIPVGLVNGITVPTTSIIGGGDGFSKITQNGGALAWNVGGLYVGSLADGKKDEYNYNGGTFTAAQLTVRADGEFNHNNAGSPLNVTGAMSVGATATGNSTFNLNGNILNIAGAFTFGTAGSTGTPTFNFGNVATAEMNFTSGSGSIHVNGTSNFVIPDGLTLGITVPNTSIIGTGAGFSKITQNGSALAWNGGGLFVGSTVDGQKDEYVLNGGSFSAVQLTIRADGEFTHNSNTTMNVASLTVGSTTGANGFDLGGKHLNITSAFNYGAASNTGTTFFDFGNPATAQLTFTGASQFNIAGNNTFIVPAGLVNPIVLPGQTIFGNGAGASVYQQDGGTVTINGVLYLANIDNPGGETDRLILNGGALNINNTLNFLRRGVLTVNGGTLSMGALNIGATAGYATGYESTGGVSNFSQTMTLDSIGDAENDFIDVSGGTVNVNGAGNDLVIHGTGTATISGGTINVADDFLIGRLSAHVATVNQSGGRVNVGDQLELATVVGSTGTYNLNGGELNVNGILKLNANLGTDTFNLAGGKLGATTLQLGDGVFNYTSGLLSPGLIGTAAIMSVNGNLLMPAAGGLEFDLAVPGAFGGPNDLLFVNGDLTLDGTIYVNAPSGLPGGIYPLISFTGNLTDNTLVSTNPLHSIFVVLNDDGPGGTVFLFAVPEPSTALLLGCGGLSLVLVRRRKNARPA